MISMVQKGTSREKMLLSWVISHTCVVFPTYFVESENAIIEILKTEDNKSVIRNLLRLFTFKTAQQLNHEFLINFCFDILMEHKTAVAVQVFAMTSLLNILVKNKEKDFMKELKIIIEDHLPYQSAA